MHGKASADRDDEESGDEDDDLASGAAGPPPPLIPRPVQVQPIVPPAPTTVLDNLTLIAAQNSVLAMPGEDQFSDPEIVDSAQRVNLM